jgi:hypothetical protein
MNDCQRFAFVLLLILVCAFNCLATLVFATNGEYNRASLRDLKGVYVSVENLDPEVREDGLSKDLIRKVVVSRLKMAGIKVLSREEWFEVTGSPYLYVNANILKLKDTGEYVYSVNIALKQNVYPVRESVEILGAATWSIGGIIGITGNLDKIRTSVKRQVEQFIEAYLAENPKEKVSPP